MSHDGCEEVAWVGRAFPFLLHHPNSFLQTENYGSAKQKQQHDHHAKAPSARGGSDALAPAGTGTWNGPAPRGYQGTVTAAAAAAPAATAAAMRQPDSVRIGPNATPMPLIGLGTAALKSPDIITKALELGYRHIDCASAYRNQEVVGQGMADFLAVGRRSELFITSKLWMDDRRPERVRVACEKTIAELGCQYLDLYLMHWPEAQVPGAQDDFINTLTEDKGVSILDTWRAMEALVDAGLVKALGVSNFSVKQVEELLAEARIKPAVNQVELHPLLAQRKLVGVCFRKGVVCVGYSPLGSQGVLGPASMLLNHPVIVQVAQEAGKTPAQVLLRWNMQRGVPVIPKSSNPDRLKENIEGAFDWHLTATQKRAIDELDCGLRYIAPKWKDWGNPEEGGVTKPSLVLG